MIRAFDSVAFQEALDAAAPADVITYHVGPVGTLPRRLQERVYLAYTSGLVELTQRRRGDRNLFEYMATVRKRR